MYPKTFDHECAKKTLLFLDRKKYLPSNCNKMNYLPLRDGFSDLPMALKW